MSNYTHTTSALSAANNTAARVVPTSACATGSAHTAIAMWSKHLSVAPVVAGAVKANRNKGAGAPGFWDPV
jgi:hypothetical protein